MFSAFGRDSHARQIPWPRRGVLPQYLQGRQLLRLPMELVVSILANSATAGRSNVRGRRMAPWILRRLLGKVLRGDVG